MSEGADTRNRLRLIHRYGHDLKALRMPALVDALEGFQLHLARRAVGRPEIQKDDVVSEVGGEIKWLPIDILQAEGRSDFIGRGKVCAIAEEGEQKDWQ